MANKTKREPIDHDRLFKELITTFFYEFVDLLLPDVSVYLERDSLYFLNKEVFTDITAEEKYEADITAEEKHEADIVVKARFRNETSCFLVHIENQSTAESNFGQRMFRYFARLHEKYAIPVYPVVIFSCTRPLRAELAR